MMTAKLASIMVMLMVASHVGCHASGSWWTELGKTIDSVKEQTYSLGSEAYNKAKASVEVLGSEFDKLKYRISKTTKKSYEDYNGLTQDDNSKQGRKSVWLSRIFEVIGENSKIMVDNIKKVAKKTYEIILLTFQNIVSLILKSKKSIIKSLKIGIAIFKNLSLGDMGKILTEFLSAFMQGFESVSNLGFMIYNVPTSILNVLNSLIYKISLIFSISVLYPAAAAMAVCGWLALMILRRLMNFIKF